MRLTSKGQVTIPRALREQTGLLPGTEVTFSVKDGAVVIRPSDAPGAGRGAAVVARLRGRGDVTLTTDEILALTRT